MTLSLVGLPAEAACGSPERDRLDVRLHAPTPDTVIVWVAGAISPSSSPYLAVRVQQQLQRASHVILDLSSVSGLAPSVAADLRALEAHAESCGTQLHIAGAENPAVAEPLRCADAAPHLAGPADAVLAVLTARAAVPMKEQP